MSAPDEETDPPPFEALAETIEKASKEEQDKLPAETDDGEEQAAPAAERPKIEKFQAAGRRGARERRKLEKASQELEQNRAAVALAAQERAELEEARELRKLRETDPAAYARKTRLDLDKLTDGLLKSGKPEEKIDAITRRLDEEKAERERRDHASALASARDEERKFQEELAAKADEYPAIADMEPDELFGENGNGAAYRVGRLVAAEMKAKGWTRGPTNAEVMMHLNAIEQDRLDKRAARLGYTKGAAPTRAQPSGARTISRSATSQRAAAPPPADDFNRQMSSSERVEAMVRLAKRQQAG